MARIHELAGMYGALADATRLRILGVLAEGEVSVGHIHEALRIPQPTVSRHLAQLRRAGLVRTRRDGLWVHYRLAEVPDPSARAALSAAIHAVGHAPATRSDQKRLESRVVRIGTKGPLPVVACCAPGCSVIEIVEGPPSLKLRSSRKGRSGGTGRNQRKDRRVTPRSPCRSSSPSLSRPSCPSAYSTHSNPIEVAC